MCASNLWRWSFCASLVAVLLLALAPLASACTFTWAAVTTYADGTPVSGVIIYRMYYRPVATTPGEPIYAGTAPTATLLCPAGEYYVTASTLQGGESVASSIVLLPPSSGPVNLQGTPPSP